MVHTIHKVIHHLHILLQVDTHHLDILLRGDTHHLDILLRADTHHLDILLRADTHHLDILLRADTHQRDILLQVDTPLHHILPLVDTCHLVILVLQHHHIIQGMDPAQEHCWLGVLLQQLLFTGLTSSHTVLTILAMEVTMAMALAITGSSSTESSSMASLEGAGNMECLESIRGVTSRDGNDSSGSLIPSVFGFSTVFSSWFIWLSTMTNMTWAFADYPFFNLISVFSPCTLNPAILLASLLLIQMIFWWCMIGIILVFQLLVFDF